MKVTTLYVSASGKSAIVAIEKSLNGMMLPVATGFVKLTSEHPGTVGHVTEIPDTLTISTEDRNVTDEETGEVKTFTWIKVA